MTDGWTPAQKKRVLARLPKGKGGLLTGVVRVSVKPRAQLCVRIAGDIATKLGWESDDKIGLLVGSGDKAGKVRLVAVKDEVTEGRTVRAVKLRGGQAITICFTSKIVDGVPAAFDLFTAPHEIVGAGLNIDLTSIIGGADA